MDTLLIGIPGEDVANSIDAGVVMRGLLEGPVYTQSDGAVWGGLYRGVLSR